MTINLHNPNFAGLIKILIAQSVTPEAAAKAIEEYFTKNPGKMQELLEEVKRKSPPWANRTSISSEVKGSNDG